MNTRRSGQAFAVIITGVVFAVAGGLVVFLWAIPTRQAETESVNWPTVPGVIDHSEVRRHRRDGKTQFGVDIAYHYVVNGQRYDSTRLHFGGNFSSSDASWAHKTVKEFAAGKEVPVYYDPEDHSSAVLMVGTSWMSFFLLVFGGVFFVVGLGFAGWPLLVVLGSFAMAAAVKGPDTAAADGFPQPATHWPPNQARPSGSPQDSPTFERPNERGTDGFHIH